MDKKKEEDRQKQGHYDNLRQKRIEKIDLLRNVLAECNQLISSENTLVAELKELRIEIAADEVQLAVAGSSEADCINTISLYESFKMENEKNIKTIVDHYCAQWDAFESRCHQWTTHELCLWLRKIAFSPALTAKDMNINSLVSNLLQPNLRLLD